MPVNEQNWPGLKASIDDKQDRNFQKEESFEDLIEELGGILDELPIDADAVHAMQHLNRESELSAAEQEEGDPFGRAKVEMQETFIEIMQQVLRPVTRYMKAMTHDTLRNEKRELFEVINLTVTPLIDKVEAVDLMEHTAVLLDFKRILARILANHFGTLASELRDELLACYSQMKKVFALNMRGNIRAVNNILAFYRLLCFNPKLEIKDIRRFFALGIPSMTWVRHTPAKEIASLSGMSMEATRLLKRLAVNYREPVVEEEVTALVRQEDAPPPPSINTWSTTL